MAGVDVVTIYKDRDNSPSRVIGNDGYPFAFIDLGVSALSVVLGGIEYSSEDGYVEFTNVGEVKFLLHKLVEYPSDVQIARLVAYDGNHPRGKVLVSELSAQKLAFQFV